MSTKNQKTASYLGTCSIPTAYTHRKNIEIITPTLKWRPTAVV